LLKNLNFATESTRTPLRELTIKKNLKFSTSEFTKMCQFEITKQKIAPSQTPLPEGRIVPVPSRRGVWEGAIHPLQRFTASFPNFELTLTPLHYRFS